jgi:SAM-dependent methyltransferase
MIASPTLEKRYLCLQLQHKQSMNISMIRKLYKRLVPEQQRIALIQLVHQLRAPLYYGRRFYCNCCGKRFRKLLPKGHIRRENAQCPYCGSLERTRLLHLYLREQTDLFRRPLKVLHIAPERCLFDIFSKLDIEYIDGDINPAYARHLIDITAIPYPDGYFDLILCSHVLGHVPDEAQAIRELRRVLRPDGQALIMTLLDLEAPRTLEDERIATPTERLARYGEPDLCRRHGRDFGARLEQQGFRVERIDYRQALPAETVARQHLGDGQRELIFKCER